MVAVKPEKGEDIERAIKRFLRKCKKLRIVEDYCDRQVFQKPSVVRRKKKLRRIKVVKSLINQDVGDHKGE